MTDLELNAILAEDAWLRRLAGRLVQDPDAANDIVQDAWLARLSGQRADSSHAWLAGLLRNVTRRRFRTQSRERARLLRAASEGASESPPTDELVADLQVRERVARELTRLDEPFRRAVYLVHVRGWTVAKAAASEGVAASTMSVRVKDGLARLRQRLDQAFGGDRRAWTALLVPMPGARSAAKVGVKAPVPVSGPVSVPASVPAVALGAAAAVLVVAAAAVGAWSAMRPGLVPPVAHVEPTPVVAAPAARPELRAAAALPRPLGPLPRVAQSVGVAQAHRNETRIVGTIVDAKGQPAEGATWTLFRDGMGTKTWDAPSGVIGRDGEIDVSLDAEDMDNLGLYASLDGVGIAQWRWRPPFGNKTFDLGTVPLHPLGIVSGRVVNDVGDPILGHAIRVSIRRSDTVGQAGRSFNNRNAVVDSETGIFELERVPSGDSMLSLSLGPWRRDRIAIEVKPFARELMDLEAVGFEEAMSSIQVRLSGRPFAATRSVDVNAVRLLDRVGSVRNGEQERSGSNVFRFPELDAGTYAVEVQDARWNAWRQEGVAPGAMVRAKLVGNSSVSLTLATAGGSPVERCSVDIEWFGELRPGDRQRPRESWRVFEGDVPPNGLVLTGLVAGDVQLKVTAAQGIGVTDVVGLRPNEARTANVRLSAGVRVQGHLTYVDGTPSVGTEVVLVHPAEVEDGPGATIVEKRSWTSRPERVRVSVQVVNTDSEGAFFLEAERVGTYIVVARTVRGWVAESEPVELLASADVDGLRLTRAQTATFAGTVQLPENVAAEGWSVQLAVEGHSTAPLYMDRRSLGSSGGFDLGEIEPGTAHLYLFQPDTPTMWSEQQMTGTYRIATVEVEANDVIDRAFYWPDPAPLFLTFDVEVPDGYADVKSVWLTGQPVQGQAPSAKGPGPRIGPLIAEALPYGVAASGDGWAYWKRAAVRADVGTATLPLRIELSARRVVVRNADGPVRNAGVAVLRDDLGGNHSRSPYLTTFHTDDEGYVDIALSPESYLFRVGTESVRAAWPLLPGADELRLE